MKKDKVAQGSEEADTQAYVSGRPTALSFFLLRCVRVGVLFHQERLHKLKKKKTLRGDRGIWSSYAGDGGRDDKCDWNVCNMEHTVT